MLYHYRIASRLIGNTRHGLYTGTVDAPNHSLAMLLALKQEFGDDDLSDPIQSLADWVGNYEAIEQLQYFIDNQLDTSTSGILDTGEHTYDIEVQTEPFLP